MIAMAISHEHLKSHKLHDKDVDLYAQNYDLIEDNIDIEEPNSFEKIDYSNKNSSHIENCNISIQECNNNSYIKSNSNNGKTSVIVRSESLFLCHKCGQMFLTEEEYNHHCIMHETKAHCSVCGDDVPQEAYGEHIIQHAVVDDGQWLRCAHCEKTFLNETLLLVHYRIHIQDTQFFCTECNQEFNQAIDLKYHTLSVHGHLQLQPYHCYICLRRFSQPHAIINHMRLHTGEMPFKCQECGMKVECKTKEDIPTAPRDLTWSPVDAHSVRLNWQIPIRPNGIIISYYILYSEHTEEGIHPDNWSTKEEQGSQLSSLVNGLASNTLYYFCMKAETRAGTGPSTPIISLNIPVRHNNYTRTSPKEIYSVEPQDPLLGIVLGISIGVGCIIICAIIIVCRNRCFPPPPPPGNRYSACCGNGHIPQLNGHASCNGNEKQAISSKWRELDCFTPMLSHFPNGTTERHLDT